MSTIDEIIGHRVRAELYGPVMEDLVKYHNTSVYDTLNCLMEERNREIHDVVTPDYRLRIARGEIINNPCYMRDTHTISGKGSYFADRIGYNETYSTVGGSITQYEANISGVGYVPPSFLLSQTDLDGLIAEAKQKAIASIDPTPYAFGEDVGEIRETLRFFRRPFSSLLKLGRKFEHDVLVLTRKKLSKRQQIVKAIRSRKYKTDGWRSNYILARAEAIAETYTEIQFAAAPLIRSSMDILEAATWSTLPTEPERRTARGFATATSSGSETYQHNWSPTIYDIFQRGWEHQIDVRAGILYQVSNPVQNLRWRLGLRVKDIPETVWQLMPLSFMVDRVWNISRAIRGLTNLLDPSVRMLAAWVTYKSDVERTLFFDYQVNPGWNVTVAGDTVKEMDFSYTRETWSPSASDTIPPTKPAGLIKDIQSTADLCALVYQRWYRMLHY